jgi:hypothetical protein
MGTAMQHPVFGELVKVEIHFAPGARQFEKWEGRVRVDFFARYDFKSRRAPVDLGYKKGEVDLLLVSSKGPPTPTPSQESAFVRLLDDKEIICNAVIDAIWNYFKDNCLADFCDPDENAIPESRDDLTKAIRFSRLSVLDDPKNDGTVIGFGFECSWDAEHRLGVLVSGKKVVEVAGSDITWAGPTSGNWYW